MKAIRQPRGEVTRQAILDAAERVFAEVGFAAARLEDVAEDVGIRRPSIVYYFASKQELYDEVEAAIFADMHAFAQARAAGIEEPFARLLALLDAWLDFNVGRPNAARIILRLTADATPRQDNPIEFSASALEDIDRVVAEGVASGAFRPVTPMQVLNGVAAGALLYVCNSDQVGENRRYDPADPVELSAFRALMHRLAAAAVLREG
jgi:TetR/AcrR family transcriptional regulator